MKRIGVLLLAMMLLAGCSSVRSVAGTTPVRVTPGENGPVPAPKARSERVAFIREGNLWTKPLDGDERKLTENGGYSNPAFSASGDWLLVRQGERFWTIRIDGTVRKELPISGRSVFVAWSPTDDRIAYRTTDQIGLLNADGTGNQTLAVLKSEEHVTRLAWSPDGKWIGYDLNGNFPGMAPGTGTPTGIRRVSPDGGNPIAVYTVSGEMPQCVIIAGWSPDSANMLFWPQPMCSGSLLADGTALLSVPADGGSPRQIASVMLTHPDFLAVAKSGAIATTTGGGRITWAGKMIQVTPPTSGTTSGATAPIPPTPVTPKGTAAISPSWSPDGSQVAYAAMADAGSAISGGDRVREALSGRHIWIAEASGTSTRQLTNDAGFRDEAPTWISGDRILFARLSPENRAGLWVIPAAGGQATEVAPLDGPPDWFGFYGWIDWPENFGLWLPGKSDR